MTSHLLRDKRSGASTEPEADPEVAKPPGKTARRTGEEHAGHLVRDVPKDNGCNAGGYDVRALKQEEQKGERTQA